MRIDSTRASITSQVLDNGRWETIEPVRRIGILLLLATPGFADAISVGIKAGVPLTDTVATAGEIGQRPFLANIKRFTIGPVLDIRLPLGLGIEIGALYKRFDQQAGQVQEATPTALSAPFSKSGQSWEFPVAAQYRFLAAPVVKPYVEAGVSFNRLSGVLGPIRALASRTSFVQPESRSESRKGVLLGAGIEIKLPFLRVTPGLRYVRYAETQSWIPSANAVDFLVGFTF